MFTDITTGPQTLTSSGAATGTADVSAMTGDFTVIVLLLAMTATSAVIVVQDSAAGDFSDAVTRHTWNITGPLGESQAHHVSSYDPATSGGPNTPPDWRLGSANNKFRISVTLTGGNITLHSFVVN